MTFQLVGKIDTLTSCELISDSKKKVQKKLPGTRLTEDDSVESPEEHLKRNFLRLKNLRHRLID